MKRLAAGLLVLLAIGCSHAKPKATPAPATPVPTVPATPGPSGVPVPSGAPAATPGIANVQAGPDGLCGAVNEKEWQQGDCVIAPLSGGRAAAVAQARRGSGALPIWRVTVYRFDTKLFEWVAVSRVVGPEDTWSDIRVRRAVMQPGSNGVLVIGYRFAGTGDLLDYDVLAFRGLGDLQVVGRRTGLSKASVKLREGRIEEYAADYPGGEPPCCPPRFAHNDVRYSDGSLRVVSTDYVKPDDVPPSDL